MLKNEALQVAREYAARVKAELDSNAEIYLFGSAARNEMHGGSDIDIAVVSEIFTADVIANRVKLMLLSNLISHRIEPHPVIFEDWKKATPFAKEIKNFGVLI